MMDSPRCGFGMPYIVGARRRQTGASPDNRAVLAIMLLGGFILALSAADAYGASTTITLDRLPDAVYAGQQVIFTGTLTSGGSLLSGGIVTICEDDPFIPDECLASGATDNLGRYFIVWTAEAATIEVDLDVYAEFKSTAGYSSSQTSRQTMSVIKYGGSLTLDAVPARAAYGDAVTFSGILSLDGHSPEGSIVYIKDEDAFNPDDLLVSAYVDHTGRFAASWIVEDVDPDYTIDIQAVYEANSLYYRMATPIQKLRAYDGPPTPPQPDPSPITGDGYMELYHALDFEQFPRIAIVPAPDSYDEVRGHIVPVKEGILQFTAMLEQAYGAGDWSVVFEVVEPGGKLSAKPDIMLDLVTRVEDAGCGVDYAGWANITTAKPVPAHVCSMEQYSDERVRSTAAHEFVHTIGVGHTFNIAGDMLCSIEDDGPTCPNVYSKSTTPSALNLAAVAAVYGTDGFRNPNSQITYGERFRLGSQDDQSSPDQGYTITPAPETTYQTAGIVYTDYEQYMEGEVVLVDGIFWEAYEGEVLDLHLTHPDWDSPVWVPVLIEDGEFAEFFYTPEFGTYDILLYGDLEDLVAFTSFDVADSTDAVFYTDHGYYDPGDAVLITGFYWGSYDGTSSMVVFDPAWNIVDVIEVDVVEDFFDVRVGGYYLPGRYVVDMYDEWDNFVASSAFIVNP